MSRSYNYVLEQGAFEHFVRLDEEDARHLAAHFRWLAHNPNEPGAEEHRSASGRLYQVHLIGHHTVIVWADHAVKELRIVEIYAD